MPDPEDGKNTESALKEKDEKIAALEAKLAKAEEAEAKSKGIAENAEKKFNEWGNELGELRKEREEMKATLEEIKAAGTQEPPKKKEEAGKEPETAEQIEESLDDDQRKLAEEAFGDLDAEGKIKYRDDPEFRKKFLETARDSVQSVPDSPWSNSQKKTDKKPNAINDSIKQLFEKAKQRSGYTPDGSSGGENRGGDPKFRPASEFGGAGQDDRSSAAKSGILGRGGK